MARRIILKNNGLSETPETPDGYKAIGDFDGVVSQKSGSIISPISGGGSTFNFQSDGSLNDTHINRLLINDGGIARLSIETPGVDATLGVWRSEGSSIPDQPTKAHYLMKFDNLPSDMESLTITNTLSSEYLGVTFMNSPSLPTDVLIGVDIESTRDNLLSVLNSVYPGYDWTSNDIDKIDWSSMYYGSVGDNYFKKDGTTSSSVTNTLISVGKDMGFESDTTIGNITISSLTVPDNYILFRLLYVFSDYNDGVIGATMGSTFSYFSMGESSVFNLYYPDSVEEYARILSTFWNKVFMTYSPFGGVTFSYSYSPMSLKWGIDIFETTSYFNSGISCGVNWPYGGTSFNTPAELVTPSGAIPAHVGSIVLGPLVGVDGDIAIINSGYVSSVILATSSNPVVVSSPYVGDTFSLVVVPTDDGYVKSIVSDSDIQLQNVFYIAIQSGGPGDTILVRSFSYLGN